MKEHIPAISGNFRALFGIAHEIASQGMHAGALHATIGNMQPQGSSIITGSGAVVCHARLTVVAGGSVIQGSDELGHRTLAMVDELAEASNWTFEAVASALHQLVLDTDPRGVAAVLADDAGEVMLFAFDRASAQGGEVTAAGNGRSGWSTEVADGSGIQLRLDNVPFTPAETTTVLRSGLVPGAGAVLTMHPVPRQELAPPQAQQPAPLAALGSNYLPAPPPSEFNRVDSSLLPPPPGEWRPAQPPPPQPAPASQPPPLPQGPPMMPG